MQHIEGTELDRKMDEVFGAMMARGLSESEIMAQMLGHQANEDAKSDEEIEFDPANFQLDPELFAEF